MVSGRGVLPFRRSCTFRNRRLLRVVERLVDDAQKLPNVVSVAGFSSVRLDAFVSLSVRFVRHSLFLRGGDFLGASFFGCRCFGSRWLQEGADWNREFLGRVEADVSLVDD